jgi:hypothetical protein
VLSNKRCSTPAGLPEVRRPVRKHQQVRLLGPVRQVRQVRPLLRRPVGKRREKVDVGTAGAGTRDGQGRNRRAEPEAAAVAEENLRILEQVHHRSGEPVS